MIVAWKWLQSRFFGSIDFKEPVKKYLVHAGQKVWECNLKTGVIEEAEVLALPSKDRKGNPCIKREVVMKPNCIYEFAINGENATRKFENRIKESLEKK